MLIAPGGELPTSLGCGQYKGPSLVTDNAPGISPLIVRELYHSVQHPSPSTGRRKTPGRAHDLAVRLQDIYQKLFEVEFSRPIEVVSAASFRELHHIIWTLFT